MSFDITVQGGTSVKLPTGGKYCDRDIIITAEGGGTDTSKDTVIPEALVEGYTAHDASGEQISGINPYELEATNATVSEQASLIEQIKAALEGKAAGGGETTPAYKTLYQRVEYIESAEEGTYPYVVTDFIADNDSGLEIIAAFPIMQDRIPMGSRLDGNATRFYCVYPLSTSSCYYGFNVGASVSCALTVNTQYRLQTNFLNSRLVNIYDMNGICKGGASISATLVQQTAPVSIFGYNYASNSAVTSKREFKLYSARCSQKNEVVREYIPCYRKSDGVIGLYEKFTDTFLTAETGAFTKGADIDW